MRHASQLTLSASIVVLVILGCGGGTTAPPPPPPPVTPPVAADNSGYFVWFNPSKTLYRSNADASTWTAVAGTFPPALSNYYLSVVGDAGGRLYAGRKPSSLFHSEDAGKTWAAVAQSGAVTDGVEYRFCAGAADELYGVGADGSGIYSTDAGQSWTVGRVAKEGARGAGDGFNGGCGFSAAGELAVDGWYFDPPGPVTATSKDHGATWTSVPRAANNTSTVGIGHVGNTLFYAARGGYTGSVVYRFDATAAKWENTGELKGVADREWALSAFATDGKRVVGWENPGKNAAGPTTSFVHISDDGAATFRAVAGPVAADPTPDTWDEYLAMGWSSGKTPAAMPAAKPVAAAPAPAAKPEGKVVKPGELRGPRPPGMGGDPNGKAGSGTRSPSMEEVRKQHNK